MRLAVIGCGYVGLVTGSCLAAAGHEVVATDNDAARIATLQAGRLPIYEENLDVVMDRARAAGRLRFTTDGGEAIRAADVIFICVGTPPLESGEADLSAIDNVARLIASEAHSSKLVVEKSTVPASTGQQLQRALAVYGRKAGLNFRVASNPEFLREGTAVGDFFHPDRIVVGIDDPEAERQLRGIYQPLLSGEFECPQHAGHCPPGSPPAFLVTTIASAELIKHASNSFLALKISYANVIADLCEKLGGNVGEVTRAMGMDPRIGPQFLNAGLGFGGFCLPKDIQAFIRLAERHGVNLDLLKQAEQINKRRVEQFVEKIQKAVWVIKSKKIAVLGLAFKPNTDDIRFSPAIDVVRALLAEGAVVHATDPVAIERASRVLPGVIFHADPYEVVHGCDAVVLLTEWQDYRDLDWSRVHSLVARPLVLDGRNALSQTSMKALGFEYHSFGRPDLASSVTAASL